MQGAQVRIVADHVHIRLALFVGRFQSIYRCVHFAESQMDDRKGILGDVAPFCGLIQLLQKRQGRFPISGFCFAIKLALGNWKSKIQKWRFIFPTVKLTSLAVPSEAYLTP